MIPHFLPNPPLRLSFGSKGYEGARGNTFGHRFNHATLCLTQISTTHPAARPFRTGNCMLNSFSIPSKNIEGGSDNKILRGVSRVSLVLSCILGLFNFSSKMNPKLNTAYASVESMDPKVIKSMNPKVNTAYPFQPDLMAGGEVAFESIDPKSDPSQASFDAKKIHIEQMKKLDQLRKEYYKSINSEGELSSLRDILVEILIIQGKFQEAREHLDDKIHRQYLELMQVIYEEKINNPLQSYEVFYDKKSITQILLYKAIVHTLLKDNEAAKWWEAFAKTLAGNE